MFFSSSSRNVRKNTTKNGKPKVDPKGKKAGWPTQGKQWFSTIPHQHKQNNLSSPSQNFISLLHSITKLLPFLHFLFSLYHSVLWQVRFKIFTLPPIASLLFLTSCLFFFLLFIRWGFRIFSFIVLNLDNQGLFLMALTVLEFDMGFYTPVYNSVVVGSFCFNPFGSNLFLFDDFYTLWIWSCWSCCEIFCILFEF